MTEIQKLRQGQADLTAATNLLYKSSVNLADEFPHSANLLVELADEFARMERLLDTFITEITRIKSESN